jgi:hypothetical protein
MARRTATALATALALAATAALAVATEEQIARLGGPELTPIGAERAGNVEGIIPDPSGSPAAIP